VSLRWRSKTEKTLYENQFGSLGKGKNHVLLIKLQL